MLKQWVGAVEGKAGRSGLWRPVVKAFARGSRRGNDTCTPRDVLGDAGPRAAITDEVSAGAGAGRRSCHSPSPSSQCLIVSALITRGMLSHAIECRRSTAVTRKQGLRDRHGNAHT